MVRREGQPGTATPLHNPARPDTGKGRRGVREGKCRKGKRSRKEKRKDGGKVSVGKEILRGQARHSDEKRGREGKE